MSDKYERWIEDEGTDADPKYKDQPISDLVAEIRLELFRAYESGRLAQKYDETKYAEKLLALVEPVIRAKVDEEYPSCVKALEGLVELKDYKDKYGKDDTYLMRQPLVWHKAKAALKNRREAINKLGK